MRLEGSKLEAYSEGWKRGWVWGMGQRAPSHVAPPHQLGDLGEHCKLPMGSTAKPQPPRVLMLLCPQMTSPVMENLVCTVQVQAYYLLALFLSPRSRPSGPQGPRFIEPPQPPVSTPLPTDSPRTLVFGIKNSSTNSKGFAPSEGIKWEWGRKNSQFSANKSPYLRNGAR